MPKLTDWFDGNIRPTIIGVYERCWEDGRPFMFPFYRWDGSQWTGFGDSTPAGAAKRETRSHYQNGKWRGLAEQALEGQDNV